MESTPCLAAAHQVQLFAEIDEPLDESWWHVIVSHEAERSATRSTPAIFRRMKACC